MIPNLHEATRDYWHKLDELEEAYQEGKIPLEEVNARVNVLMQELARQRRLALAYFWQGWQQWLTSNQEILTGILFLASIACIWASTIQTF